MVLDCVLRDLQPVTRTRNFNLKFKFAGDSEIYDPES